MLIPKTFLVRKNERKLLFLTLLTLFILAA